MSSDNDYELSEADSEDDGWGERSDGDGMSVDDEDEEEEDEDDFEEEEDENDEEEGKDEDVDMSCDGEVQDVSSSDDDDFPPSPPSPSTNPAFADLVTITHHVPTTKFDFILHISFGIMYGRMLARKDSTHFWSHLLKVENEESWWRVFRGYLRSEMIPLLVHGQPPTAWDLADIGWVGNGVGVYIKIGLGNGEKESMIYIGSASYFPQQATHVYGLDKRRRQHEYALAGTKKESSMFNNIQIKYPHDRQVVFSTLFRIPLDLKTATAHDLSSARIMSRFGEGILSEWLQAWNPHPEYNRLGKIPDRLGHELWGEHSYTYFGTLGHSQFAEPFKLPSGQTIIRSPEEFKEFQRQKWTRENNNPKYKKRRQEWHKNNPRVRSKEQTDKSTEHIREWRRSMNAEKKALLLQKEKKQRENWPDNLKAYKKEYSALHYKGLNTPQALADLKKKHGIVARPKGRSPKT